MNVADANETFSVNGRNPVSHDLCPSVVHHDSLKFLRIKISSGRFRVSNFATDGLQFGLGLLELGFEFLLDCQMLVSFSFVGVLEFAFNKVGNIGNLEAFGTTEDTGQGVILRCRNGVEGVVMTTSATHCKAKKAATYGSDLLVDYFHAKQGFVLKLVIVRTKSKEAGAR